MRSHSADSGLKLDLEIALSVVSAKVQPHELFSPAEDALKSVDVIDLVFTPFPNECLGYLLILRVGLYLRSACYPL